MKEKVSIYIPYKCAARLTACVAEVLQSTLNFSDERHYKTKKYQELCLFILQKQNKTKQSTAQDVNGVPQSSVK